MPVCEECETSVDEFSLLSMPIKAETKTGEVNRLRQAYRYSENEIAEYRTKIQEAKDLKDTLETRLFEGYNAMRTTYQLELKKFNGLLNHISKSSKTGKQLHILDTYHYIGDQGAYKKIFSTVLLNAILASDVELETSHWAIDPGRLVSYSPPHTDLSYEHYEKNIVHYCISGKPALHFRHDPPKELSNSIKEIFDIRREILENHLQNWEENYESNHPTSLGNFAPLNLKNIREVREYCPACGSLEWQGIHVDVAVSIKFPGTEQPRFKYSGRITEISEQFLPDIVKAGQQKLDLLQKRIKAFEKFNKGIEKKVKRRLKKRADDKKKAEIKALKAKLRELEEE